MKFKKLTAFLLAGLMMFGECAPFLQEFGNNTAIMADAANGINYFDFAFEFEKLDNGYYACYAKYNKDDYCTFWGFYNKNEVYSNSNGNYNGLSNEEKKDITSYTILSEIGGYPVKLIQGVVSIAGPAFQNCTALNSVTIPEGITTIGQYAFSGCSSLTSIDIPNSVTQIVSYAFQNCSNLTSVHIGDGVTEIGYSAFQGCNLMKSITIPATVKTIGANAIGYSTSGNVISDFVIYGEKGSAAETYALENAITFKSLSEAPSVEIFGDIDGNGTVDAVDASYLLQYIAYVGAGYEQDLHAFMEYLKTNSK